MKTPKTPPKKSVILSLPQFVRIKRSKDDRIGLDSFDPIEGERKTILASVSPADGQDPIDIAVVTDTYFLAVIGQEFTTSPSVDREAFVFPVPESSSPVVSFDPSGWKCENGQVRPMTLTDVDTELRLWFRRFENFRDNPAMKTGVHEKNVALVSFRRRSILNLFHSIPDDKITLAIPITTHPNGISYATGTAAVGTGTDGSAFVMAVESPVEVLLDEKKNATNAAEKIHDEIKWLARSISKVTESIRLAVKGKRE